MLRVLWKLVAGAVLSLSLMTATAHALTLETIGTGFEEPIYVTSDPGNPDRLFVVERGGLIMLVQNGEVKPFADIRSRVFYEPEKDERGLLSIALPSSFDSTGRFYLYYTGKEEPGEIHVAEMVASGNSAPTSSLRDVIAPILHPEDPNHYGGQLQFGPEGALFVSTGDGGGANDEHHNAQNESSFLGKILRVIPTPGFLVPAPTVWSIGLRNPFRFSFDRTTGDLWIGDVGQEQREEVDFAAAPGLGQGANYGWNCYEGSVVGPADDEGCATSELSDFVFPVFEYTNPPTGCAAVIGGYVARGPGMGDLYGRYLYGDLCTGDVRSFSPSSPKTTDRPEGVHVDNLNSFGEDVCGRLYAVSGNGPVYRLVGPGDDSCAGTAPPAPQYKPSPASSYVAIRAVSRKVQRHRRGLITAWVIPCKGRRGDPVTLWRGRRQLGTRRLDRACSARFRPRIDRRSTFRVTVKATAAYLPAISRKLTIKPVKKRHRHR